MNNPLIILLIIFFASLAFSDTPPPNTVKAKTYSGDGVTPITSTGATGALDVNIASGTGTLGTVNQGDKGSAPQAWYVQGSFYQATQPVSGTFWQATQPVSGTFWQTTQPVSAASLPLPSGASTSALQSSIITALGSPFQAGASIANTSFAATQATASSLNATVVTTGGATVAKDSSLSTINTTLGTPMQNSGGIVTVTQGTGTNLHTVVDSGSITVTPVAPANASQASGTVSTVITLSPPSNAQGFILQNLQTSTANVRFSMGATATTSNGMELAPGQDSNFVPFNGNVSLVAESGTQGYNVQWVAR